ncbi:MAG TPA: hypothetical protein VF796_28160 [Humisphaera sp.]
MGGLVVAASVVGDDGAFAAAALVAAGPPAAYCLAKCFRSTVAAGRPNSTCSSRSPFPAGWAAAELAAGLAAVACARRALRIDWKILAPPMP